jgi:hypothetical protein
MTKQHIFIIENNLQKVGQSFFHRDTRSTCPTSVFSRVPDNRTNVNVEVCHHTRLVAILVVMSVLTFETVVILYIYIYIYTSEN